MAAPQRWSDEQAPLSSGDGLDGGGGAGAVDWTLIERELDSVPEHFKVSPFDTRSHVLAILQSSDPHRALQRLKEQKNRVEALVDTVVAGYHQGFNRAIHNYSQILERFSSSQKRVEDLRQTLEDSQEYLSTKRTDLHKLHTRARMLEVGLELVGHIRQLSKIPHQVQSAIGAGEYYMAARLLLTAKDMLQSPRVGEISAIRDLARSVDDYLVMLRTRVTKELLDILFRVETEASDVNRAITECTQASIVLDEFGSFLVTAQAEAKDLIASHISQVLEAYLLENASAIEKINTDVLKGGEDSDWAMHKDVLSKGPVGAMEAAMELTLKTLERMNVLKAAVLSCSERDSQSSSQGLLDANVISSVSPSESREDHRQFVNAAGSLFELIYMAIHQDLERRILAIGNLSVQNSNDLSDSGNANVSASANATVGTGGSTSASNLPRRHSSGRTSTQRDQQQHRNSILEKSTAEVNFSIDFESAFKSRSLSTKEKHEIDMREYTPWVIEFANFREAIGPILYNTVESFIERAKALAADHSTLASNGDYLLKSLHAFVVDRYFPSIDRRIQQQLDAAFASETAFSLSWARYVSDQLGPIAPCVHCATTWLRVYDQVLSWIPYIPKCLDSILLLLESSAGQLRKASRLKLDMMNRTAPVAAIRDFGRLKSLLPNSVRSHHARITAETESLVQILMAESSEQWKEVMEQSVASCKAAVAFAAAAGEGNQSRSSCVDLQSRLSVFVLSSLSVCGALHRVRDKLFKCAEWGDERDDTTITSKLEGIVQIADAFFYLGAEALLSMRLDVQLRCCQNFEAASQGAGRDRLSLAALIDESTEELLGDLRAIRSKVVMIPAADGQASTLCHFVFHASVEQARVLLPSLAKSMQDATGEAADRCLSKLMYFLASS